MARCCVKRVRVLIVCTIQVRLRLHKVGAAKGKVRFDSLVPRRIGSLPLCFYLRFLSSVGNGGRPDVVV